MPKVKIQLRILSDDTAADAVWKSVGPYRPGDEPAVEAMYERAELAKDNADPRWIAMPPKIDRTRRVGWMAVAGKDAHQVVGIVDLADADGVPEMPAAMRAAQEMGPPGRRCRGYSSQREAGVLAAGRRDEPDGDRR